MTRRDFIHKWFIYALGLVPIWLLDACILPRYPLWGSVPMLLPLAAAAVSVLEGAYAGTGFGLAVGLLWELAYPGGFGGMVFFLALAGMAMGAVSQYALSQSFAGCLICAAGLLACWSCSGWHGCCLWTPQDCLSCSGWPCQNFCGPWPGPL